MLNCCNILGVAAEEERRSWENQRERGEENEEKDERGMEKENKEERGLKNENKEERGMQNENEVERQSRLRAVLSQVGDSVFCSFYYRSLLSFTSAI